MVDGKLQPKPPTTAAGQPVIKITSAKPAVAPGRIAELVRQIRLAEAQGRPYDDLSRELYDAVESLKK
jgi:hypothetical protein